jgi:hypothetical protein
MIQWLVSSGDETRHTETRFGTRFDPGLGSPKELIYPGCWILGTRREINYCNGPSFGAPRMISDRDSSV